MTSISSSFFDNCSIHSLWFHCLVFLTTFVAFQLTRDCRGPPAGRSSRRPWTHRRTPPTTPWFMWVTRRMISDTWSSWHVMLPLLLPPIGFHNALLIALSLCSKLHFTAYFTLQRQNIKLSDSGKVHPRLSLLYLTRNLPASFFVL